MGFGFDEFGEHPFGLSKFVYNVAYDRTLPSRQIEDDENFGGGHLKALMYAFADIFQDLYERSEDFPKLVDPTSSISGVEQKQVLSVQSVETVQGGFKRVYFDDLSDDVLMKMFSRSYDRSGRPRQDGWIAVIDGAFFPVESVDSYERYVDVVTNKSIGSSIEFRPPDMLVVLGQHLGLLVDRLDPPDYTRRALFNLPLIKQLKVTKRLFALIGKIYGFDVNLESPFCISKERYDQLVLIDPSSVYVFNINGEDQYFTTSLPKTLRFDIVAADAFPVDSEAPQEFPTSFTSPVLIDDGLYCIRIDVDVWKKYVPFDLSSVRFVDEDGEIYFVEKDHLPHSESIEAVAGTMVLNGNIGDIQAVRPGTVVISYVHSGGSLQSYTDNGLGQFVDSYDGSVTFGTIDYDTGFFAAVAVEDLKVGTDVVIQAEGAGLCVLGPKGGSEPVEPQGSNGQLRFVSSVVCRSDYKPSSVYVFTIEPKEVLTEPGSDLSRLIDRISQKIDEFIPLHIRLVDKSYLLPVVVSGLSWSVDPDMIVDMDSDSVDLYAGPLFDEIPADQQNADTDAFVVSASLSIEL